MRETSSLRGFVLHPSARVVSGRTVMRLLGVLESGAPFAVEDDRFRPGLYLRAADVARARGRSQVSVEPTSLRSLGGEPLVRASTDTPAALMELRSALERTQVELFEADLRPASQYMIERALGASICIEGEGRMRGRVTWFRNPELAPASFRPNLRTLSIDIETLPDASRILSAALVGCDTEEVHWVSSMELDGAQAHADERSLLARVAERICALDPDVLTGWNVVDFDLRVLATRAQALGIPFRIGRTPDRIYFRRDEGFTRQSRAEVSGRQVLDALGLVRDSFIQLEDYRLETAAQHILGRGKRIDKSRGNSAREILRMYREEPSAFLRYNLEDARLVRDILEDQALVELAVERSLLSGMQLDRVGASIASFDRVYLPELHRRKRVAPCVQRSRKSAPVRGGAVLDSNPGFFGNVAVFDFKSLYPSLIRTFNLDPLAHALAQADCESDCESSEAGFLRAPNGACFSRAPAILPEILARFATRREVAKERGDRHTDLAIKLLMNSFFGVLGSASCRFFDPELANAITTFGQQVLLQTRAAFDGLGARVLYGDTDSVFVELGAELDVSRARQRAHDLRDRVQAVIHHEIRERYRVAPQLELELDQLYARFFQPSVRGGRKGSKKRYAGLVDGVVAVVGLEAVRRDWPEIAKRLQLGMLERAFLEHPVLPFVAELVRGVRSGECDDALVIRKRLRKGAVERYTKQLAPHVEAARKSGLRNAREVRYVMTSRGAEPVLEDAPLPAGIDYAYYVDRVMRPVADAILHPLGQSFDEALGRPRQLSLF